MYGQKASLVADAPHLLSLPAAAGDKGPKTGAVLLHAKRTAHVFSIMPNVWMGVVTCIRSIK